MSLTEDAFLVSPSAVTADDASLSGTTKNRHESALYFPRVTDLQDRTISRGQLEEELWRVSTNPGEFFIPRDYFYLREDRLVDVYEFLYDKGGFLTRFSNAHPFGSFIRSKELPQKGSSDEIIRFSTLPNQYGVDIKPVAPRVMTDEAFEGAPFGFIETTGQVIGFATGVAAKGVWHKESFQVVPWFEGILRLANANSQYGQGGFEGIVAQLTDDRDTACIYRLAQNAERFARTCHTIKAPIMPPEYFIEAVEQAVRVNRDYIPGPDSKARLYIRPFVMAVDGGAGVTSGTKFIFVINVFPYGSYAKKAGGVEIAESVHERACAGIAARKANANYTVTLGDTVDAANGELRGHEGTVFSGVFYTSQDARGKRVLDEYAAANIFLIGKDGIVRTPSLNREKILDGITRDSVIQLLRTKGFTVDDQNEVDFEAVKNSRAGFLTGTAVGLTPIKSMKFQNGSTVSFEEGGETGRLISELQKTLMELRKGRVLDVPHELRRWARLMNLN